MVREVKETGATTLPPEQATRDRQAANISAITGADSEQGIRLLESLESAAQHPAAKLTLKKLSQPLPSRDRDSS